MGTDGRQAAFNSIDTKGRVDISRVELDRALKRLERVVKPSVRISTDLLVEQYHETLRKLARE